MPTQPTLTVTPAGEYSFPMVRCAQLLASCAEVQAMFGVADATSAFDLIDYPLRDVETYGPPLPGIIVQGLKQRAGYDGSQYGELLVSLWDQVDDAFAITEAAPLDWKNDALMWLNRCGAIRTQMKALSKTPLDAFGGERFNAIQWHDRSYPGHDYQELGEDTPAVWFRFAAFAVEWTT